MRRPAVSEKYPYLPTMSVPGGYHLNFLATTSSMNVEMTNRLAAVTESLDVQLYRLCGKHLRVIVKGPDGENDKTISCTFKVSVNGDF